MFFNDLFKTLHNNTAVLLCFLLLNSSERKTKMRTNKINESGRSMVEMLGVLAIIGVLSVAGIAGYSSAMNKHRANEIINSISMLSTEAHTRNAMSGLELNDSLSAADAGVPVSGGATGIVMTKQWNITGIEPFYRVVVLGLEPTSKICQNIAVVAPNCTNKDTPPLDSPTLKRASQIGWCFGTCCTSLIGCN